MQNPLMRARAEVRAGIHIFFSNSCMKTAMTMAERTMLNRRERGRRTSHEKGYETLLTSLSMLFVVFFSQRELITTRAERTRKRASLAKSLQSLMRLGVRSMIFAPLRSGAA